ncbi:MAG TPA: hypothetical protein VGM67_15230 [Gemmatimonadaceae bacterium]|jgi:hypothetical protein
MGCIARLGCLIVLVVAGAIGWFTRDQWLPARFRPQAAVVAKAPTWEPLSDSGAARTRSALNKLSQRTGPVFQTVSGADAASYVFTELAKEMPPSTDSIEAMVNGETVSMRANVRMADVGSAALGSLASMFGDRERVELSGTFDVMKPGLAEFQIQNIKVGGLTVPHGMIPQLVSHLSKGERPAGLSADGLPLPIPHYVGDIRVANGKITLYKNVE